MKYLKYLSAALLFAGMLCQAAFALAAGHVVTVRNAWIPEAPPVADVMAAYFEIDNNGSEPVTITHVSSPAFADVMMHKTVEKNGMSYMIHLPSLTVAPHSKAIFHRGGMHLMLMQPKHSLKKGDKVSITMGTADKQKIHFTAVVKAASLGDDH